MSTYRFGIIGAGNIANHFCNAVKLVEGAEVAAVSSTSLDRAEDFARRNGIGQAYGSYEEMLQSSDIDIVYIATTHNFHMKNIRLCLEYGKHVLCEKAMVLTADDAREAFRLAKEKGLFLMEAMWTRFLPQYVKAKQWITEGRIGEPRSGDVVIGFHVAQDPESRILNPKLAGGAMYDIGVYAIEPISYLIGESVVDAVGFWRPNPITGVDDHVSMILRYPSCDATLQCMVCATPKEYVMLTGSKGYIEIPFVTGGHTVRLYDGERKLVEEFHEEWQNGFVFEIEEVIRCLDAGLTESPVMPARDTIECARIYDTVLRGQPFTK